LSWDKKDIIEHRPCLSKTEVKAYLEKTLSNSEQFAIENHMLDCEFCQSAIDGYIKFPSEISESAMPSNKYNWLYLAAAVLLLLLGASAFFSYQSENKPDSIFANYYDTPSWDILTRGDIEEGLYTKTIQLYNQKHYVAALENFDTLIQNYPEDNRLRLYKGIAHLENKQFIAAETELQTVRINSDIYFEEATWYLALLNTKINNKEEAIRLIDELINLGKGFFFEKAITIKKGLQD